MRKVLGFTSIRADYDLLSTVYKGLKDKKESEINLIVSGAHLSKEYGESVNQIYEDGIPILTEIETLISSNSKGSRLKTASILLQNCINDVKLYDPDVIIYAGDREDVIVAALVGSYLQIPTVHLYAGDHVSDGHVDNPVRHATSKLSSIHMVSIPSHKRRLIAMGEVERRIHVTGAPSIDRFVQHNPTPRKKVLNHFGVSDQDYAIVIFHPQDLEISNTKEYLEKIISVLKEKNIFTFINYPNTDPGNKDIIKYVNNIKKDNRIKLFKNLNRDTFLSLYKNASLQVGNSSSGIIESGSIPIPVVNVGLRQKDRKSGKNVIKVGTSKGDIRQAIEKATSRSFQKSISGMENMYGDGKSSQRVIEIIMKKNLKKFAYKTEDPLKCVSESMKL